MLPQFLDTTLRDGEQRPGISFTRQDKIDLARGLDAWGVPILEVGIPAMGRAERTTLDALHGLGLGAEILVWNRLTDGDLDLCLAAGYPSLHFSVPVSDVMLKGKLSRPRSWVLGQVDRVVGRAVAAGRRVSFGAEDASRANPEFLAEVFLRAEKAGASRVRFADTLGLLTPAKTTAAIAPLARRLGVPIDFHGHNDFGLATANTVAAFEAGAPVLSCSLLGLGERAGNAALEEVAAVVSLLGDAPARSFDLAELRALCVLAAARAGVAVPAHKALVGDGVFSHQSGIHVDGLLKDPNTYEAWPPENFGARRRIRFGKHSGSAAVKHLASLRGAVVDEDEARQFLEDLRDLMATQSGVDTEAVFETLIRCKGGHP
jgi:homocitrate synthase NifV